MLVVCMPHTPPDMEEVSCGYNPRLIFTYCYNTTRKLNKI